MQESMTRNDYVSLADIATTRAMVLTPGHKPTLHIRIGAQRVSLVRQTLGVPKVPELTYLTAAEVAPILRISVLSVCELCRAGKIPAAKPGRAWLIKPTDVEAYIDAHRQDAA
jgi:excisionase family DNA binding protein